MMCCKRILIVILTLLLSVSFAALSLAQSLAQEKAGNVSVDLTAEERAFLAGKQLRLGVDSARPPFEFLDEKGVYSGICAGFIEECAKRLGVTISKVTGLTVSAAIDKVKSGEVDVIPKVTPTPEREKHLLFTQPFVTFPSVIISRKDTRVIGGLDDLSGLKIGVLKGLVVEELLKRDYPRLPLIALTDVKSALMDLSIGKIDVFVDNLGTVSYNIEKLGITNLKIAATTPYNHDLAFGVRKDWPLLASSLDKALASMTNQEKTEIKNRWLAIKYDAGINWRIFVPIGAGLLIIIIAVFIWNRSLRRVIRERERIQEELKENAKLLELRSTIKAKLSQISVGLQKATTIEELARTFLSQVASLTDAAYGVFFLMDEQKQLLQAVGGYGWMEEEAKSRLFRIGQGLVGQCAREKKPLGFNNSPDSNIRITWGGGHFDPRAILLLPVLEQDKILAVIELGALQPFTSEHRALLDELLPTLALNLLINRRNLMTQELLAKGQEQIAELGKVRKATLNILEDLEVSKKETVATMQKIDAMSQAVSDAMVMIDGEGKVLFWNQAAEKLFGYTAAEAMGMDFHTLAVSPELREKAHAGLGHFAATGEGVVFGATIEITAVNRNGETFPVEVNLSPFQVGEKWFAVGTVRDITERKQAEKELKERMEEMERFNRLTVDREGKMIRLKEEINTLQEQAGKEKKYKIVT
jgi:PAS domain S-box-containing protein